MGAGCWLQFVHMSVLLLLLLLFLRQAGRKSTKLQSISILEMENNRKRESGDRTTDWRLRKKMLRDHLDQHALHDQQVNLWLVCVCVCHGLTLLCLSIKSVIML